jgi:hypothetical protein
MSKAKRLCIVALNLAKVSGRTLAADQLGNGEMYRDESEEDPASFGELNEEEQEYPQSA